MLNFNDSEIIDIITSDLDLATARTRVTLKSDAVAKGHENDPLWGGNEFAQENQLEAFTALFADKITQKLSHVAGLKGTEFIERLWLQSVAPSATRSTIVFFLATPEANQELFTLVDPLCPEGFLSSSSLPTLLQVTAKDENALGFSDSEISALIVLVKELYTAGYAFKTVDETVLQPVDGLTFETKFDTSKPATVAAAITEAGALVLRTEVAGPVAGYQVLDDEGHDWMDLGTDSRAHNEFIWESTSIPEELIGQTLTLEVAVRSVDNVPAMDELFVIASSNAILMRETAQAGEYALNLPNHKDLTVSVDAAANTVKLGYPEADVQIIELDNQYPFIGQWLKAVLPKKPAFN